MTPQQLDALQRGITLALQETVKNMVAEAVQEIPFRIRTHLEGEAYTAVQLAIRNEVAKHVRVKVEYEL